MTTVHHRHVGVKRLQLCYPEPGLPEDSAVVLLHGFPATSFMFADYAANIPLYLYLHAYLRDSRVPARPCASTAVSR